MCVCVCEEESEREQVLLLPYRQPPTPGQSGSKVPLLLFPLISLLANYCTRISRRLSMYHCVGSSDGSLYYQLTLIYAWLLPHPLPSRSTGSVVVGV